MNSPSTTIDHLPFELFEMILDQISIEDKIRLRSVNKRWLSFIDNLRIKKLYLSEDLKRVLDFNLTFHCLETDDLDNNFIQINSKIKLDKFFKYLPDSFISKYLKRLTIHGSKEYDIIKFNDRRIFNNLLKIEYLNISRLECLKGFKLCLPSLKTLNMIGLKAPYLLLDTPLLTNLKIKSNKTQDQDIDFLNTPLNLTYIELDDYNEFLNSYKFKKLKYLFCKNIIDDLSEQFLTNYSSDHLKQIQFLNSTKAFKILIKQKESFKFNNLEICFRGIILSSVQHYEQCFKNGLTISQVFMNNINKSIVAEDLKFIGGISFKDIEIFPSMNHDLKNVLSRFDNLIQIRIIKKVENEKLFIEFAKCLKNFKDLEMHYELQSNELIEQLNKQCPQIKRLSLLNFNNTIKNSDLNSIFHFKNLIYLKLLNFNVTKEFIMEVFEKLRFIFKFTFSYEDKINKILVLNYNQLKLFNDRLQKVKFNNLDGLSKYLNNKRMNDNDNELEVFKKKKLLSIDDF